METEYPPIDYVVTFYDKQDKPRGSNVVMRFTDYWTACTTLLAALPEGTEFDVRDMDGNIPAV